MKLFQSSLFLLLAIFTGMSVASEWQVDNELSQLNFISIKKTNVAEVHQFTQLQGGLNSEGQFNLEINLASVDTHNPVRDERMTTFLFETEIFSTAILSAELEPAMLGSIAQGASSRFNIDAVLELHGQQKDLTLDVMVTRLVGGKLSVASVQPIILNVTDFSLLAGVDKLRELASLPSISQAVPVSFYLTLKLKR